MDNCYLYALASGLSPGCACVAVRRQTPAPGIPKMLPSRTKPGFTGKKTVFAACEYKFATSEYIFAALEYIFATSEYRSNVYKILFPCRRKGFSGLHNRVLSVPGASPGYRTLRKPDKVLPGKGFALSVSPYREKYLIKLTFCSPRGRLPAVSFPFRKKRR